MFDQLKYDNRREELEKRRTALYEEAHKEIDGIYENPYYRTILDLVLETNRLRTQIFTQERTRLSYYPPTEYKKMVQELGNQDLYETIKEKLDNMPVSNGSRYFHAYTGKIGIVMDEHIYESVKGLANFVCIKPDTALNEIRDIDLLLVTSVVDGMDGVWKGVADVENQEKRAALSKIVSACKDKQIPTAFYSLSNSETYDAYIEFARMVDAVFTIAEELIEDFKRDCGHANVYVMPLGVNPLQHNPIGFKKFKKKRDVLFTGSWYRNDSDRRKDAQMIFDGVKFSGNDLVIVDRRSNSDKEIYQFPKQYIPYVSPRMAYDDIQKLHKLYNYGVNLNTVMYSETMFAKRIYELQALGNIVFSNYSLGVNTQFPNVYTINNKGEIGQILRNMTEEEVYEQQCYGIRRVMTHETMFDRLQFVFDQMDLAYDFDSAGKVLVVVDRKTDVLDKMIQAQSYANVDVIQTSAFTEEIKSAYDMVAFMKEGYFYGEYYLEDMVNAFKYTDVDFVTRDAYYMRGDLVAGIEHNYISSLKDKYRTLFWADAFTAAELKKSNVDVEGCRGYAVDHLEIDIDDSFRVEKRPDGDFDVSVIIPIYNNGPHLLNKCFRSLLRSSIFNRMEVIMVDDGSTDEETIRIFNRIDRQYANVKTFSFGDGGSGSASRPRNKAVLMATAPYVTYLDPDNEAIADGYAYLYHDIHKYDYDMIIGNMPVFRDRRTRTNYFRTFMNTMGTDEIMDRSKELIINSNFRAMSNQALLIKREIIVDNNLTMVPGAVGQDTLFFHLMLIHCKHVKVVNLDIHIYYAGIRTSTVNAISKRFYEKYVLLENGRVELFKEEGLLKEYANRRFPHYFHKWYMEKYKSVKPEDAAASKEILKSIYKMYEPYIEVELDPEILAFVK